MSKNNDCALHCTNDMPSLQFVLAACAMALLAPAFACAQDYPSKPVRYIVPSAAGGNDDIHARAVAPRLAELLGKAFVIETRPGAGQLIGHNIAVNAPADGHTLVQSGRAINVMRFINANIRFDPLQTLTPAAMIATYSLVLVVNPSVKAGSVAEYISLARQQPGRMTVAEIGGSMPTIASLIFRGMTKIDITHVTYKEAPYVDLIAGRVDSYFAPLSSSSQHIAAGKLRPLGVTGARRSPVLPDVPTIADAGVPGYEAASWLSILAPAGTPRPVIAKLNSAMAKIIAMPEVKDSLVKAGSEPAVDTPEGIAKRMAAATEQFGRIVKALSIKPQ